MTNATTGRHRTVTEALLWPLRLTNLAAIAIHGFGHAAAGLIATGRPSMFTVPAIFEGLTLNDMARSLVPGRPLPQFSTRPPLIPVQSHRAWQCRIVALGGIAANLLSIALAFWLLPIDGPHGMPLALYWPLIGYFTLGSLLTTLSMPDLVAFRRGTSDYWACGPAFAVRYRAEPAPPSSPLLVSDRLRDLAELLAREASTRGGQSGGFSVLVEKRLETSIIFDKVVKGKREDIVRVMSIKLRELLTKAGKEGYRRPPSFEAILLHLRYATGGATHWHNAQPHWYEHYDAMVHHRVEQGGLTGGAKEVFNMIAHNGDMDGVYLEFMLNGKRTRHFFTQADARSVFLAMMPKTSSQGNSDSRSVAEWVDFMLTQGLAYKALRYAYFTSALDFNDHIATGRFDLEQLVRWADAVDQAMLSARKDLGPGSLDPGATSLSGISDEARRQVRQTLAAEFAKTFDASKAASLLDAFEDAFYRHDLTWVMRLASRDLVGEFALMVCTTLEPRMGVFSLTQAFSIGHNRTLGEIFGSAEPQSVTSALHQGGADDDSSQIYLEDGQYATIEFTPTEGSDPIRIYDRASADADLSSPPAPSPKALNPARGTTCGGIRSNWFPVNNNPKITRTRVAPPNGSEIERDLREIPFVLKKLVESFGPGGENHATMENFASLLFQNLLDPRRDPKNHDLVLYGVDFNQDLANEFTLALHSILPGLRIRAENSGNVLKEMKRTRREGIGRYGPKTIFLGISNSAQTQSTLAVVRKAREVVGAERCFVLTQGFLNSMSEAIGQGYQPDDPILPNTFVNLSHLFPDGTSGRRRAEAATIVPVATQAVLTEILMHLTERAIEAYRTLDKHTLVAHAEHFDLRPDLQASDIRAFREFQSAVYEAEIPNRVGCTGTGEHFDSPDRERLAREAAARAENQVEFVRSYALFAAYIVIATVFGVPVFGVVFAPFDFVAGIGVAAHALDAALFLTALWLIHLGIRRWQGRPLFERIGARAEVYIDRKYVARIVERYNATLFSNMPAFVTPFFYWADTVRDALHRFGIRAHRGVVTIHRSPDERMGIEEANNAAEENMVYAQLGGIHFNGGQPQSRDKAREGSCYVNASRPFQTVLSDSLAGLRAKYDRKLSPEVFRLINRRLIDLADGLITEFVIGYQRREIVNQSIWDVIRWIPGAGVLYEIFRRNDIDLRNLAGEADTANQAQIQSTKHPVSPMDIHVHTMEPRSTFDALRSEQQTADESFAVLVFSERHVGIHLNRHAMLDMGRIRRQEILLKPGSGDEHGKLVSDAAGADRFVGVLDTTTGEERLIVENHALDLRMAVPLNALNADQRSFLTQQLRVAEHHQLAAA